MKNSLKIVIILCFSLFYATTCSKGAPLLMAGQKQNAPAVEDTPAKMPQVIVTASNGRRVTYNVEVADSPYKRALGLMFRESLALDRGMIFLFPAEEQQSFWMKDTFIELDMIFIRDDLTILGIVHSAKPFDESSHYIAGQSRYVLEINGGESKKWSFCAGDRVEFINIDKNAAMR